MVVDLAQVVAEVYAQMHEHVLHRASLLVKRVFRIPLLQSGSIYCRESLEDICFCHVNNSQSALPWGRHGN